MIDLERRSRMKVDGRRSQKRGRRSRWNLRLRESPLKVLSNVPI